jgi:hypothetical protein
MRGLTSALIWFGLGWGITELITGSLRWSHHPAVVPAMKFVAPRQDGTIEWASRDVGHISNSGGAVRAVAACGSDGIERCATC